jgi:hypothetical protein
MTVPAGTETTPDYYILDHSDRCDKCGARAYVHTLITTGGSLYWCAHHWREVKDTITPQTLHINDETRALHNHIKDDGHWIEGKEATLPPPKKNHGIEE